MSVIFTPSARAMFTPRELVAAYKEFTEHGRQQQDAETGLGASSYRFGERVLIVYEESEAGLVVLIHPTSYKKRSFRNPDSCIPDNADHIAHGYRLRS